MNLVVKDLPRQGPTQLRLTMAEAGEDIDLLAMDLTK